MAGSRLQKYSDDIIPVITSRVKADYVLASYSVTNDTRDSAKREAELTRTLNNLIARASRREDIELSTIEEFEDGYETLYFPKPLLSVNPEDFQSQYGRSDTSYLAVTIKTTIDGNISSLEEAKQRIENFVGSVSVAGRTEFIEDEDLSLSIKNVERHRPDLVEKILADVRLLKETSGGASIEISGLEQVVRWERSGPLDLTVYIPYKVSLEIEN